MKFCLFRNARAVYFTHWILALSDSLAALVTGVRGVLIQVGYASNADADGAGTLRLTALSTPEWSNRTRSCREAG
jgi:hypothetical protein